VKNVNRDFTDTHIVVNVNVMLMEQQMLFVTLTVIVHAKITYMIRIVKPVLMVRLILNQGIQRVAQNVSALGTHNDVILRHIITSNRLLTWMQMPGKQIK
jgi:hypothetical protein